MVNTTTVEQYHGENATYIGEAATITAKRADGSAVGSAVNLNSDGSVTKDGVTLAAGAEGQFSNASGSLFTPRQAGGDFLGVSTNGALVGGFGFGGGIVTDALGNSAGYLTFNGNLGFGGGLGLDIGNVTRREEPNF